MKTWLLFLYGSLKRGEPNHELIGPPAAYLGEARTADGYRLLDLGAYPALAPGGTASIQGELFAVTEDQLEALDEFEGEEYVRSRVILADGRSVFAYFATQATTQWAASSSATSWSSRRSQG